MSIAPTQAVAWSLRTLAVTIPGCLSIMLSCSAGVIPQGRQVDAMMLFLLLLALTVVGMVGVLLGGTQVATARAFAAGVRTGRTLDHATDETPPQGALHLVE